MASQATSIEAHTAGGTAVLLGAALVDALAVRVVETGLAPTLGLGLAEAVVVAVPPRPPLLLLLPLLSSAGSHEPSSALTKRLAASPVAPRVGLGLG